MPAVAETLLAGSQHRLTGTTRLFAAPGAFRTRPLGARDWFISEGGTFLVVADDLHTRLISLRGGLGELAEQAGVLFGTVAGYPPFGEVAASDRVRIDPDMASWRASAFAIGDAARQDPAT